MTMLVEDPRALFASGVLTGSAAPQIATSREDASLTASRAMTAVVISSAFVAGCLTGTVVPAQWREARETTSISSRTGMGLLTTSILPTQVTATPAAESQSKTSAALERQGDTTTNASVSALLSDQQEIRWLKEQSGLTWDQLGKVFGVSRRAVHLWANGGRMNESNAVVLREISATVRGLQLSDPRAVRSALLAVPSDGYSIIDGYRRRNASGANWGQPFAMHEMLGALSDEPPIKI